MFITLSINHMKLMLGS